MKQAASAWVDQEDEHDRLTHEGLADVDAGKVIDYQLVQAWSESLGGDEPLSMPTARRWRSCGAAWRYPIWRGSAKNS